MINAFKQIRLTNINISGNAGRVEVGASGSFAYLSELNATGEALNNSLIQLSGALSTGLSSGLFALNSDLTAASGALESKIDLVSGNLNTYIDSRISGVIDMAPAALDTLNELAAALGDDENFASSLVSTLGSLSGNLSAEISTASGSLDSRITSEVSGLNSSLATASGVLDSRITSEVSGLNSSLATVSGELDSRITSEVSGLNASLSSVSGDLNSALSTASGVLDSKIDLVSGNLSVYVDNRISGVIDMAPAALDTLNELAAALGDDANFASNLVTTLGNISGSLSSDLSAVSGVLDTRITTEVSGLNSSLVTASGLLDTRLVDIESNYLDKRVGGIVSGNLDVTGVVTANGLEINGGGAGSASLFVGSAVVGINTETPSEALDVVGNGKFSGTVEVAAPSAANHASTKGYVDDLFAKQKSFSTPVTQNVESMSVTFPGSAFYSAPIVNVTMEGSVSYAFMISNRTTTGFDISFSDEVLENDIVLNVFASNQ
jgi:hypothetical protein